MKILKVGITGQYGFIGSHLYNTLCLKPEVYQCIQFRDEYFSNQELLDAFIHNCDIIVHLAGMNRHSDPKVIFDTNISLVKTVIDSCVRTSSKPYIIFSSSIQEEKGNLYGESKRIGREMFEKWALEHESSFSGLVIPNVFGPFGLPNYNSVIATFCHQLTHAVVPKIENDSQLSLIFVSQLITEIIKRIDSFSNDFSKMVSAYDLILPTYSTSVSELLNQLMHFKNLYFEEGIIPDISDDFRKNLFNTFHSYINYSTFFPFVLKMNSDHRGSFIELVKLYSGGQISFSTTKPGITRGNHFHTRKAERFAVIKGQALIRIRRVGTQDILSFTLDGRTPSFVDMPVWYTHSITNIGDEDLYTIFWISEHFVENDSDTYFENV